MKKRYRRLITPSHTSLMVGQSSKYRQKSIDNYFCDAVPEKNTNENRAKKWIKQKKARQVKDKSRPEAFAIQLLDKPTGNIRVPVLNPDGTPAMPTKSSRARKWIRDGKAKVVMNDLGIFQIQLIKEPSGRNKQPVVLLNDPGSRFTSGVSVPRRQLNRNNGLLVKSIETEENRINICKFRYNTNGGY